MSLFDNKGVFPLIKGFTAKGGLLLIHILDGQNDEILDYITLDNVISDTHRKSLEDTLETYDAIVLGNKEYVEHLAKRNRIIIPDEDETLRELIIYEVDRYRDSEGQKAHFFSHASYLELKKASIVYPNTFTGTASQHIGRNLNDTGWQAGVVEVSGNIKIEVENHTNPYEMLRRIAKEFEGELRFRIEHDGEKITGRYVDLLERIGQWRGKEVTLGKDLETIRRVEKQDIVTALLGLGPEKEDGTRLTVLVEDKDALQRWGRIDKNGNIHHLIEPYEIQSERSEMTVAEARQYTRTALNKRINSQVTYETTIIDLADVAGLEHEEVFFGDTIRIKDEDFIPPLYLEARIFEMDRSLKQKAKKDIKLGDYIEYTEEEVNTLWAQLQAEIQRRIEKIVLVNIESSGGIIFKESGRTTELTAKTFVGGSEYDEDGTVYDYLWSIYDKDGNFLTAENGKSYSLETFAVEFYERLTVRIYVGKGAEVYAQTEITLTFVKDGEKGDKGDDGGDGPPGPPGDKGEDGEPGRSVVEVSEQYYMSTSNLSPTGGAWLDDKPPHTADKFLWVRTKVTYDKAPLIEYTTPILDDGWIALSTADGNNTIIFDDVAPPIEGRKPGDVWYDTANDNRMSKFDGNQWTVAPIGERAIATESITALHIKSLFGLNVNDKFVVDEQGNVTFSDRIEGAHGIFGKVAVTSEDFSLKDEVSGLEFSAVSKRNLLQDHSFELLPQDPNSINQEAVDRNYLGIMPNKGPFDQSPWERSGSPKVAIQFAPDSRDAIAIYGDKAAVVRNGDFVRQYVHEGIGAGGTYSLSGEFKRQWNAPAGGEPLFMVRHRGGLNEIKATIISEGLGEVKSDYTAERKGVSFTVPLDFEVEDSLEIIVSGRNDRWVHVDGVMLNEGDRPANYSPDDGTWLFTKGIYRPYNRMPVLWAGGRYPTASQVTTPERAITDCTNGWILQWQAYDPGTGTVGTHYQYTHIPKAHALYNSGRGIRVVLRRNLDDDIIKYIYINSTGITGHDGNSNAPNNRMVLSGVYEY